MNTRTKLAASGLLVAALVGAATPVFAADTTTSTTTTTTKAAKPAKGDHGHRGIGSDTATATAAAKPAHANEFAALVTAGTITQAQADAFETAEHAAMDAARNAAVAGTQPDHAAIVKSVLDKLVAAGTITQTQADAITKVEATAPVKAGNEDGGRGHGKGQHDAPSTTGTTNSTIAPVPTTA